MTGITVVKDTPTGVAETARAVEEMGVDALWISETAHDPMISLALAAGCTRRLQLGTAVSVAFARSPMISAITANDLQLASRGRFVLGLGAGIETHVTKRFSMPWSEPAARMREYVAAVRAIWSSWQHGDRLRFRGDFYTHTVMTPAFSPGPNPFGPPPIHLAGVGPRMTEVAGEVADGFVGHLFSTRRHLTESTIPALRRGWERSGRDGTGFVLGATALVATGATEDEWAASVRAARHLVAFYGATPAYAPVLARHGWEDLATDLAGLARRGRWDDMSDAVDDEVLRTVAVVAPPEELPAAVAARFSGITDAVSLHEASGLAPARWYVPRHDREAAPVAVVTAG